MGGRDVRCGLSVAFTRYTFQPGQKGWCAICLGPIVAGTRTLGHIIEHRKIIFHREEPFVNTERLSWLDLATHKVRLTEQVTRDYTHFFHD
jgi:hypothetical protein